MRIPEWQNKMIRCTAKSISKSIAQKAGFTSTGSSPPCGILPSSATPSFLSSGDEAAPSSLSVGGNKKYGPDGKRKYNKHKLADSSSLEQPNHSKSCYVLYAFVCKMFNIINIINHSKKS